MSGDGPVEVRVLGSFEVAARGRKVELGGPRLRGVLARLAIAPGRTVSVEALATELWGPYPQYDVHRTVRTYVSRLRAALRRVGAGDVLVTRSPGYLLRAELLSTDAARFERTAALGRRQLEDQRPGTAVQTLTAALEMWRGDAYAEFGEEPTVAAEAARLERSRLSAVEARIEAALALGLDAQATGELEGLVRAYPTRERFWGQLMTALYRSGRQAEALAAYRTVSSLLIVDHGVEPSPWLVEIHRKVLRQDAALEPRSAGLARSVGQ